MAAKPAPVVAIVGQTASGKSQLALQLVEDLRGEIIAGDSWTVRRELDIGTAKPALHERQTVKHHLVDVVSPCEDFTAVEFQRQAKQAIDAIHARGNVPFLVGGTGLYIDSVLYDYSFSPKGDRSLRERYNQMSISELLAEAAAENLDTSMIDVRNKRRIIRLLETKGHKPAKQPIRENTLIIGIRIEKSELDKRIKTRVDHMIEQGLEKEVENLQKKYGWECEGLKGIGYAEWKDYFAGRQTLEQTKLRIIQSTKQLAKRQQTWFKRSTDIIWCSITEDVRQKVYAFLDQA